MQLTAEEVRVLGCLLEKQMTTPEYYPLTLNAAVTACNQSSNRNPVVAYAPATVTAALDSLRADHRLVRKLHAGAGSRVDRYRHVVDEQLALSPPEKAVLAVLLLRGPQTVGELKARTERMHDFASLEHVEAVLDRLADPTRPADPSEYEERGDSGMLNSTRRDDVRPDFPAGYVRPWDGPLVLRLPRQPGQKEARVVHLLGGPVDVDAIAAAVTGEVRSVSTDGAGAAGWRDRVGALETEVATLRSALDDLRRELEEFKAQF